MIRRLLLTLSGVCSLFVVCNHAVEAQEVNLALEKLYTLTPRPNYGLCTDEDDSRQLTDGEHVAASVSQIWLDKACVGWTTTVPVEIVIDLKAIDAIDAVRVFSGSAPTAEAYLPSILVAVSDDGEEFRVVRRLDNSRVAQLSRSVLDAERLMTRGRYLLVRLIPPFGSFVFVDEIRVTRGDHDPDLVDLPSETVTRLQTETRTDHQRRLVRTLDRCAERLTPADSGGDLHQRITELRETVAQAPSQPAGKVRTMDPELVSQLNGRVRDLQRNTMRHVAQIREADFAVWDVSPWAEILPGDSPPLNEPELSDLHVVAGRQEYESQAFMVTNLSDQARELKVSIQSPWDEDHESGACIKLRSAVFMETAEGATLGDALPVLDHPLSIPPWESRLIWLEIHTGNADVGTHQATLLLEYGTIEQLPGIENPRADPIDRIQHDVNLNVEILPVRTPDELPLATYSWQYLDSGRTPSLRGIEQEAVADLAAHYNNVSILTNNSWSYPDPARGDVDAQGNLVNEPDFREFDRWVELCRPISRKGMTWFPSQTYRQDVEVAAPQYRTYAQWTRRWVEHLQGLGLGYDDFFVYPSDENIRADFIRSGEAIRSVDPQIRIFATSMMRNDDTTLTAAAPYLDVCSVALDVRHPHQLDLLQDAGTRVWTYFVGRRRSSPYSTFRLALWKAFQMGATGCGFWCYSENQSKSRNLWQHSGLDYAVIYTREGAPERVSQAEAIIPSRRWEAWREGIEDYTHLHMLQQLVDQADRSSAADEARRTLTTAVQQVLADPDNVHCADEHRRRVLESIAVLQEEQR